MNGLLTRLKKTPGVSRIAGIYRGFKFLKRAMRLRKILAKIDSKMPFDGPLGSLGYDMFCLSDQVIKSLKKMAVKNGVTAGERYFPVHLTAADKAAIEELFDNISPSVRAYLGREAYLDGMNWLVSDKNEKSISENWHTDNVGNRIKVFVCVSGDRSQPTYIIPSTNRIPSWHEWFFMTFSEVKRWLGFNNHMSMEGECKLEHETGTVYIFDTQLLHRGSYGTATSKRVILHMEFSVLGKHEISRGPIGTQAINTFKFSKSLLEIPSFVALLDTNRIKQTKSYLLYAK